MSYQLYLLVSRLRGGINTDESDDLVSSLQVKPEVGSTRQGHHTILILDTSDLCLGQIGESGFKFCCDTLKCPIVSHQGRKLQISPGLYTREKGSNVGYTQPVLNVRGLDNEVIDRLLQSNDSIQQLQKEISLINNQTGTTVKEIDNVACKALLGASMYKTPAKTKGLRASAGESNLVELTSNLLGDTSKLSGVKSEEDSNLDKGGALLQRLLPNMAGAINSLENDLNTQDNLLHGFALKVQQLDATIGAHSQYLQGQGYPPRLWDSIGQVVEDLESVVNRMELRSKLQEDKLELLKDALSKLQKTNPQSSGINPQLKSLLMTWKGTIEDTARRVQVLETNKPSGHFIGSSIRNSASQANALHVPPDLTDLLNKLDNRVSTLELWHKEKGKENLTGAVQFGGFTFSSTRDVEDWLDTYTQDNKGQLPDYGLFADPQLLLHWVWTFITGGQNTSARELRDRDAISMTQDKLSAVDSFQHYVPLIFSGKRNAALINTGGMEKSRLAQIPKFSDWDDSSGHHGLKQQMADVISLVKDSLMQLIQDKFPNSAELRAFASSMLHTSISFVESLSTYMSETYNNFKDVVGDSKLVWGLVTYVVEQLFKRDFGQVRAKTIGALDANSKTSAVKMIWSAIRLVGVAQDLMGHGIKNAPAVSASYVRFVLMHSNMGKVSSLLEENKALKRKHDDLEELVREVKKTADGAKRLADQAISKVNNNKRGKKNQEEEKV